ncbi:MAG: ATP-binding protein [Dehalobacterium sp.]
MIKAIFLSQVRFQTGLSWCVSNLGISNKPLPNTVAWSSWWIYSPLKCILRKLKFFTTKEEGTGLGLPICFSIIADHKGQILVESIIGQGTSFTIILPESEKFLF